MHLDQYTLPMDMPLGIDLPRWIIGAVAALLFSAVSLPATAQWKWRDKSGQMQYSDLPPPPGVSDRDILLRPSPVPRAATQPSIGAPGTAPSGSAAPATTAASAALSAERAPALVPKGVEPALEAKRRQSEQDEANRRKVDHPRVAAVKAENCTRAQANLRALQSGSRMTRTNEKGEREVFDDAMRADESRRTREEIAFNCK